MTNKIASIATAISLICPTTTASSANGGLMQLVAYGAQDVFLTESCNKVGVKSLEGVLSTTIKFINEGVIPVNLYWIDYTGAQTFYATISANNQLDQQTYLTHPWMVRQNGECIGVFWATEHDSTVAVR